MNENYELRKAEWMDRYDDSLGRVVFPLIRQHSIFCSKCGNKLDLKYKNFHMPFCQKCRIEIMKKEMM